MQSWFGADAYMILARILAFATAIPFHEAAHAYVSDKLGDSTAREMGRLTLNPLKHLDPFGFLAMLIIGIGWAKPVPVHPERYKNPRVGMALSAVAGPAANALLAYINMLLLKIVGYAYILSLPFEGEVELSLGLVLGLADSGIAPGWLAAVLNVLLFLTVININLAVFNMLPIPPFDGSRLFGLLLPEKLYFKVMKYERIIMLVVLVLLWFGFLSRVLGVLNQYALIVLDWLSGYVDLIFGAFL